MLTQRVEPESRVGAFACDADDYLAKPFLPGEYVARMARLLRYRYVDSGSWVELSSYAKLDHINQKLLVGGTLIHLTPVETKLLYCFYQTGVCTYEYLMRVVGEGSGGVSNSQNQSATSDFVYDADSALDNDRWSTYTISALKMLVHRLKKKIHSKTGYTLIKTVYGVGFGVR